MVCAFLRPRRRVSVPFPGSVVVLLAFGSLPLVWSPARRVVSVPCSAVRFASSASLVACALGGGRGGLGDQAFALRRGVGRQLGIGALVFSCRVVGLVGSAASSSSVSIWVAPVRCCLRGASERCFG